jgi:hypothetical protein
MRPEVGTLPRPGPFGRLIRLVLGGLCANVVFGILTQPAAFVTGRALASPSVWLVILIGLCVFPVVVNIGFGRAWKRSWLLTGLAALACVASLVGWAAGGRPIGPPLGVFVSVWLLYTFGHLGISFLLASILATPGCEMRSIPHLWALVSGGTVTAHYCPGMLTPIDRWEARR